MVGLALHLSIAACANERLQLVQPGLDVCLGVPLLAEQTLQHFHEGGVRFHNVKFLTACVT